MSKPCILACLNRPAGSMDITDPVSISASVVSSETYMSYNVSFPTATVLGSTGDW
ncbi:unnamed protein product [Haemonchus placei]|uniref:DOMON domain-containing protein n=1 Tax=Haemonchus placei TaxID=6290 RepID=A0A0N4WRR3_HAEPC|nr:unnamed protein product [Haemonchus placei]